MRDRPDPNIWHIYYPGEPSRPEPPAKQPSSHADLKVLAKQAVSESLEIEYTPDEQMTNAWPANRHRRI